MARGLQAQQAQQKAAEKAAKLKKMAGNNKHDNAKTAAGEKDVDDGDDTIALVQ